MKDAMETPEASGVRREWPSFADKRPPLTVRGFHGVD